MTDYLINRKVYKDIKKYDHKQMETFLTNVYTQGKVDAINELAEERMKDLERVQIDENKLKAKLLSIKGIGEVKAAEIIKALTGGVSDD